MGRALDLMRSRGLVGSNPTQGKSCVTTLASCLHLCASVTMTETGKVIAGLAESNGSLPPIDCGLTACIHWDQLRVQRLVTSMGSFYLFTFY